MAEIICIECKTSVSDTSGYCPECGYPFDAAQTTQNTVDAGDGDSVQHKTITTPPLDTILRSLDSVTLEINELSRTVAEVKQALDSHSMSSADNTQKVLAEISRKLDVVMSAQPDPSKKTKMALLANFYKMLNSPNSMFDFMFYITAIQAVFVIVILFLVTYAVTLVR